MPQPLDPQLVAFEQKLYKGALVLLPRSPATAPRAGSTTAASSLTGKVLRFQYNPDTITRSRTGEWADRNPQQTGTARATSSRQSETLAAAQGGASLLSKSETISMRLVFDTTEQVLRGPDADATVTRPSSADGMPTDAGVLPQLAVLEQLGLGVEQISTSPPPRNTPRPEPPTEVLLVLGPARQFPVVVTSVSITEQRFNAALVPTRAEIDVRMRVLEPVDVRYNTWVGEVFAQLVSRRQARLEQAVSVSASSPDQLVEALYGGTGSLVRTFADPASQSLPVSDAAPEDPFADPEPTSFETPE